MLRPAIVLVLLAFSGMAGAQVFRCQQGDTTVFSDTPCGAGAESMQLAPPPNIGTVAPAAEAEQPVAGHKEAPAKEKPLSACVDMSSTERRNVMIGKKVFVGMRASDVRQSWGEPSEIRRTTDGEEEWLYASATRDRYVHIGKSGCVTGTR